MIYKGIFFDWDGTLVVHSKMIADGHSYVREKFGLGPYDQAKALSRGHQSTRELYPILYGDKAEEAEQLFYDFFFNNHLNDVVPFDDTLPMLERLKEQGVILGVVSNKKHVFLMREIEHLGWTHLFDSIVGAGEAEADKPSSAPLKRALSLINKPLKENDIIYVGDTETDLKCAADMPCHASLILRGRDMDDMVQKYQPDFVHQTLSAFQEAILNKNMPQSEKKAC